MNTSWCSLWYSIHKPTFAKKAWTLTIYKCLLRVKNLVPDLFKVLHSSSCCWNSGTQYHANYCKKGSKNYSSWKFESFSQSGSSSGSLEQYSLGHYGLKGKENQTWLNLSETTKYSNIFSNQHWMFSKIRIVFAKHIFPGQFWQLYTFCLGLSVSVCSVGQYLICCLGIKKKKQHELNPVQICTFYVESISTSRTRK